MLWHWVRKTRRIKGEEDQEEIETGRSVAGECCGKEAGEGDERKKLETGKPKKNGEKEGL